MAGSVSSTRCVRRGRRPKGRSDPRQDILSAALCEFALPGYEQATVRTIAKEARLRDGQIVTVGGGEGVIEGTDEAT